MTAAMSREQVLRALADGADLHGVDLRGMDLHYANLRGAVLRHADLRGANLRGADLYGADLYGANLRGANLRSADLRYANLRGADLYGTNLSRKGSGILRVDGLPSGQATFFPTPYGWHLQVGCWTGSVEDLRALIATDHGWPEAKGADCARRRPGLLALVGLCEAHMVLHAGYIETLAARWGTSSDGEVAS